MTNINCSSCDAEIKEEFKYCPFCGEKIIPLGTCQNCGHQNDPGAKFCQACGSSITTDNGVTILEDDPIPDYGLVIEFGYSTSTNYDLAVKEAEAFDSYKKYGNKRKATHRILLEPHQIEDAMELIKYIRGWKSARIYEDGEQTSWNNVTSFIWCYEQRKSSFKPEFYCFGYENNYEINLWGCTQARLPLNDQGEWCTWGKWLNDKGDWEFDKERIKHEIQKALHPYRFCPAINPDLIEDALDAIPNKVNPAKDKNWKFIESWVDEGIGPTLTITTTRHGYKETVKMKGAAPNGPRGLKSIIKNMKHKLPKAIIK